MGGGDFGSPISLGNCGGDFGSPIQASADVLGARSPRGVPKGDNPPFEAVPTQQISRFPVPSTSHLPGAVTDWESGALFHQAAVIATILTLSLAMDSDRGSV